MKTDWDGIEGTWKEYKGHLTNYSLCQGNAGAEVEN